jgi:hypothetical protein
MKKMIVGLTMIGLISVVGSSRAWADRVGVRQSLQGQRIHQGIHSGALTCGETRHLFRQQRHIRRAKSRAWSDGRVTFGERAHLERMQDRASRHIYAFKHNYRHQR